MAAHFHSIPIKKIIRETPDCVSLVFDIPDELTGAFLYKEGQNITLRKTLNDIDVRRSYSICNAPYENELKVAVKKVAGGLFSGFANDVLKSGDIIDIMPPSGNFNARLSDKKNPSYLAVAAGSGITPVISIIKHTLKTQPDSCFTLIYGNKSREIGRAHV